MFNDKYIPTGNEAVQSLTSINGILFPWNTNVIEIVVFSPRVYFNCVKYIVDITRIIHIDYISNNWYLEPILDTGYSTLSIGVPEYVYEK